MQEFAPAVECDDQTLAIPFSQQSVLDLRSRHRDKRARVLLARLAVRGGVEDTHEPARRIEQGRRGAGEGAVTVKEVFAAVHRYMLARRRDGTERVRSATHLGPQRAGPDAGRPRGRPEAHVGDRVEQQTVGRGECDHVVGAGDLQIEVLHFGDHQPTQHLALLARRAQCDLVNDRQGGWTPRVEPRPQATRPALGDIRRHEIGRDRRAAFKLGTGAGHYLVTEQIHGRSSLIAAAFSARLRIDG